MRTIGTITRLQIQRGSLKRGEKPTRVYDPTPLVSVPALSVTPEGALGASPDGADAWIVDVHHRAHPHTKNEDGLHGISLGFTAHYDAMRKHFGGKLELGCAGENIIATSDRRFGYDELAGGVAIPAGRADGVRQREDPAEPFDHARLATHDGPSLRWVVANLQEATVHRHVVPVHVEDDDVARGDADHRVPRLGLQPHSEKPHT